jgi:hypothetical protein
MQRTTKKRFPVATLQKSSMYPVKGRPGDMRCGICCRYYHQHDELFVTERLASGDYIFHRDSNGAIQCTACSVDGLLEPYHVE